MGLSFIFEFLCQFEKNAKIAVNELVFIELSFLKQSVPLSFFHVKLNKNPPY